ncbi:MAG TPA: hypothetical protein VGD43_24265 [Micromonospora sp.]
MGPSAPRRPVPVVGAAGLLILMAVGALVHAATGLVVVGGTVDRFRVDALSTGAGPSAVEGVVTLLRMAAVLGAVLALVVAAVLVGLALGDLRGGPGSRVATWVVCGRGLLCGVGSAGAVLAQWAAGPGLVDETATRQLVAAAAEAYPSWWAGLTMALSVGQVLGYLVVTTLLALPASNAFFRRRPAVRPAGGRPPAGW